MTGGARAFDRGGYDQTALAPVLPVKLDGRGAFRTGVAARAALTPAGKAHPLTRVLADPDGQRAGLARPAAAHHPQRSGPGQRRGAAFGPVRTGVRLPC